MPALTTPVLTQPETRSQLGGQLPDRRRTVVAHRVVGAAAGVGDPAEFSGAGVAAVERVETLSGGRQHQSVLCGNGFGHRSARAAAVSPNRGFRPNRGLAAGAGRPRHRSLYGCA